VGAVLNVEYVLTVV